MKKLHISKNSFIIIYKLLHDALFLALGTFTVMLIGEGLIPGFVSARISFSKVFISITLLLLAIIWLGKNLGITYELPKIKGNKLLPFLVLFSFLLIGNSMLHFALWANIIISLTTLLIFFLLYELIFHE
ncbi:MAG: hypothetical protein ACD_5C00357G0001 [uncultured bacterium]|nr:MAG: hypothetical protein ACD_5C00357G0001 [uncultured bacterium]